MVHTTQIDAPEPFELWRVDLLVEPEPHELECLSAHEIERAARFVFAHDRRRYRAAHVALRQVLSGCTGVAPEAIAFTNGPFGKPSLVGIEGWSFNLSHSADVALIAVSRGGEIGVDVEVLRAMSDATALAQRNFTPTECAELVAAGDANRDLAFLRGWVRKEACLKAVGSGLSIAPETFEAGLSPDKRVTQIKTPQGPVWVEVGSLPESAGTVSALARIVNRA